jgi:hypothetical protein
MKLTLNAPQLIALQATEREVFFVGGLGSGKTYYLGAALYRALCVRGALCGLFAPTLQTVSTNTLPNISAVFDAMGFYEGEHYVIGRVPPPEWNVPKLGKINQSSILTTRYGSYCVLGGLDNFNTRRGIEFDEIFIDEFRDVKKKKADGLDPREVLIGRLRGKAYKKQGLKHRIHYATTPPDNVSKLTDIFEVASDYKLVTSTSFANRDNLPDGYIESILASYDELKGRREVYGELVGTNSNLFCYAFEADKTVAACEPLYHLPAYLSFDFNVNPMTAILAQSYEGKIRIIAEFRQNDSDIYKICKTIRGEIAKFPKILVTGDASGQNRSANLANGSNSYDIILKELGLPKQNLRLPASNPNHDVSRIFINALFARHPDFVISPACKWLIKDITNVTCTADGTIDKQDASLTHQLDCLRYYLHAFHDGFIKKHEKIRGIRG